MWCNFCQRDLPAVSEAGFNGVRCTQCGTVVSKGENTTTLQTREHDCAAQQRAGRPAIIDKPSASKDTGPVFIEVNDQHDSDAGNIELDCNQINKPLWRVDSAHQTINKSGRQNQGNDERTQSIEFKKNSVPSGQKDIRVSSSVLNVRQTLKARSGSFALAIRFSILVVLLGFSISLWSMAAGHFTGWLTGQLVTFAGIGWSLATIGQRIQRLSRTVEQLDRQICTLENSRVHSSGSGTPAA